MEITKDKVTELFCIIDEFYKVFFFLMLKMQENCFWVKME